jgi:hypothetical protein
MIALSMARRSFTTTTTGDGCSAGRTRDVTMEVL